MSPPRPRPTRPCTIRRGFTPLELAVVLALGGLVLAILLPALAESREEARQSRCELNLRRLAVAAHLYHDTHRVLPPGAIVRPASDASGEALTGFGTLLLPYLDERELAAGYDAALGFDHPANQPIVTRPVPVFLCPSTPAAPDRTTALPLRHAAQPGTPTAFGAVRDYDGVRVLVHRDGRRNRGLIGRLSVDAAGRPTAAEHVVGLDGCTDGLTTTILLVEQAGRPERFIDGRSAGPLADAGAAAWAGAFGSELASASEDGAERHGPQAVNAHNGFTPYGFHEDGALAAMADGSVRLLDEDAPWSLLWALGGAADGKFVPPF